jgi:hypothetical protein
MSTLTQDCRELERLRQAKKDANEAKKAADAAFEEAERRLIIRMESEEAESHRADGRNFTPTRTTYGQIQDRAAFIAWAMAQEGDEVGEDETLYEIKERKGLVSELVRERLDNGEPLPPGVTFYVKEYVSTTAAG